MVYNLLLRMWYWVSEMIFWTLHKSSAKRGVILCKKPPIFSQSHKDLFKYIPHSLTSHTPTWRTFHIGTTASVSQVSFSVCNKLAQLAISTLMLDKSCTEHIMKFPHTVLLNITQKTKRHCRNNLHFKMHILYKSNKLISCHQRNVTRNRISY